MKRVVEIEMQKSNHKYMIDILLYEKIEEEPALLTIINKVGEHLLKMELNGSKYLLELSAICFENCNLKIETPHNVVMKKIS